MKSIEQKLIKREIIQRKEEGCDTTSIENRLETLHGSSDKDFTELYDELMGLEVSPTFPYHEPSSLEEIRLARPSGKRKLELRLTDEELYERICGGWLGRAAGCALGKPVEGWPKHRIDKYLTDSDVLPLDDFLPFNERILPKVHKPSTRGNITQMDRDDDMDFPILGLIALESKGPYLTPRSVADIWLSHMPFGLVYTAENVAYRNFVANIWPPESAIRRNPYREWIGAQIRADIFGYAAPGWPEKAAALAFQDGCISHQKNGIYGEMFVAAMISASFVFEAIDDIVDAGLGEIPENCRLAETVKDVKTWCHSLNDWEEIFEKILDKYGHYHGVHTINNAALVVLGLYFGQENFESGIVTAVRAGWDTDCNGATVGSILGVRCGSKRLPGKWVDNFNDRLMSAVKGHNENRFSSLAKRTVQVAKKVLNSPAEQEAVSTKETSPGGCWDLETGWGRQRVNFDAGTIKFLEDGFEPYPITACQYQGETLNFSFAIDKGGWDFEVDFEGIVNADAIEGSFFPGDTPVQGKRSVSTEEDSAESSSS